MIDRTPAAHAAHDELLVVRLYGGDVDAAERVRALEQIAECRDCSELFADLGAIADADVALQIPPRPRDFTLTEGDAARLRRPRLATWFGGGGLRRSLGGSLAALGLVGLVLTGVASLTGGAANPVQFSTNQSLTGGAQPVAAPSQADLAAFGSGAAATAAPAVEAPTPAPAASAAASERSAANLSPTTAGASPGASAYAVAPATQPPAQLGDQGKVAPGSQSPGLGRPTPTVPVATGPQGGIDARLLWLVGFGLLFLLGVAVAILPGRRRGHGRGGPS